MQWNDLYSSYWKIAGEMRYEDVEGARSGSLEEERERETDSSRNCIGIRAISILGLTYLQMFSLAEIHGRFHRPGAARCRSFYIFTDLQACPRLTRASFVRSTW